MNTITPELKSEIARELKALRENHGGTDKSFATKIGINPAQLSQVLSGNYFKVLSDANWISLARQTGVSLKGEEKWVTAETPVYNRITKQLNFAQDNSVSFVIVDDADIGKTYTAKEYALRNKFAVYVDCSNAKTRGDMVTAIAKGFGTSITGRYRDIKADVLYYINNHAFKPIIMLDEAGDLDTAARLEIKALWNATEGNCAWIQIGADGLREVIRKGIEGKRVGFVESFSRYGNKYQRYTPEGKEDRDKFKMQQAAMIIKANAPAGADIQKILVKTKDSLRRIRTELKKKV